MHARLLIIEPVLLRARRTSRRYSPSGVNRRGGRTPVATESISAFASSTTACAEDQSPSGWKQNPEFRVRRGTFFGFCFHSLCARDKAAHGPAFSATVRSVLPPPQPRVSERLDAVFELFELSLDLLYSRYRRAHPTLSSRQIWRLVDQCLLERPLMKSAQLQEIDWPRGSNARPGTRSPSSVKSRRRSR